MGRGSGGNTGQKTTKITETTAMLPDVHTDRMEEEKSQCRIRGKLRVILLLMSLILMFRKIQFVYPAIKERRD